MMLARLSAVLTLSCTLIACNVPAPVFGGEPSRPDPTLTPGQVRPLTKEQVCATKWGTDSRHVPLSLKRRVCRAYGYKNCPGPKYIQDHAIPRELGGADTYANIWPQPSREARAKDKIENQLHREVCTGLRSLEDAQRAIAHDWTTADRR